MHATPKQPASLALGSHEVAALKTDVHVVALHAGEHDIWKPETTGDGSMGE